MPSSALPFAARVIADRAREAGVRVAATAAAESAANACQLALQQRAYSDAPANPRGRERLLRDIAESPAVDELAAVFTQFILTRFGSQEPTRAQRQNTRGFAHKRLGLFLNFVDELVSGRAAVGEVPGDAVDTGRTAEDLLRPRARRRGSTFQQRRAVEQHAVDIVTQLLM